MPIDWDAAVLGPTMAVFGDMVTYEPVAGAPYAIPDAVFDEAYQVLLDDPQSGVPVTSTTPVLGVRRSAMQADPLQNDSVFVPNFGTYVVREVKPDGHGFDLLLLNYVGP